MASMDTVAVIASFSSAEYSWGTVDAITEVASDAGSPTTAADAGVITTRGARRRERSTGTERTTPLPPSSLPSLVRCGGATLRASGRGIERRGEAALSGERGDGETTSTAADREGRASEAADDTGDRASWSSSSSV